MLHVHDRDDDPDAPRSAREAPRPPPERREACDPPPPPRTPRLLLPPPGFSAPPRHHHHHHHRHANVPPPPRANPAPRVVPPAGGTHRASGVGDDRGAYPLGGSGLHPARRVPAPPRAPAGPGGRAPANLPSLAPRRARLRRGRPRRVGPAPSRERPQLRVRLLFPRRTQHRPSSLLPRVRTLGFAGRHGGVSVPPRARRVPARRRLHVSTRRARREVQPRLPRRALRSNPRGLGRPEALHLLREGDVQERGRVRVEPRGSGGSIEPTPRPGWRRRWRFERERERERERGPPLGGRPLRGNDAEYSRRRLRRREAHPRRDVRGRRWSPPEEGGVVAAQGEGGRAARGGRPRDPARRKKQSGGGGGGGGKRRRVFVFVIIRRCRPVRRAVRRGRRRRARGARPRVPLGSVRADRLQPVRGDVARRASRPSRLRRRRPLRL